MPRSCGASLKILSDLHDLFVVKMKCLACVRQTMGQTASVGVDPNVRFRLPTLFSVRMTHGHFAVDGKTAPPGPRKRLPRHRIRGWTVHVISIFFISILISVALYHTKYWTSCQNKHHPSPFLRCYCIIIRALAINTAIKNCSHERRHYFVFRNQTNCFRRSQESQESPVGSFNLIGNQPHRKRE